MGQQAISKSQQGLMAKASQWFASVFSNGEHRPIKIILISLAAWFVLAQVIFAFYPDKDVGALDAATAYLTYVWKNAFFLFLVLAILFALRTAKMSGDQTMVAYIKGDFDRIKAQSTNTAARILFGVATFLVFSAAFTGMKTRIPAITPFYADELFANMDRWLFLGHDPWTYFAFLYEIPAAIIAMDFFYDVWAVLLVCTWIVCFMIAKHRPEAYRYNIAVLLTWFVGGNVAALLLSSAGPCYYEYLTGDASVYGEQMRALSTIYDGELRSTVYQGVLWEQYQSGIYGFGGISAMPSMHCATSFLLVWAFGHYNPYLKAFLWFFCLLVCISSFVLAWHYAVDAVLALLIAWPCWWVSGKITRSTKRA